MTYAFWRWLDTPIISWENDWMPRVINCFFCFHPKLTQLVVWTTHSKNMTVKLDHFPKFWGENNNFWNHHPNSPNISLTCRISAFLYESITKRLLPPRPKPGKSASPSRVQQGRDVHHFVPKGPEGLIKFLSFPTGFGKVFVTSWGILVFFVAFLCGE